MMAYDPAARSSTLTAMECIITRDRASKLLSCSALEVAQYGSVSTVIIFGLWVELWTQEPDLVFCAFARCIDFWPRCGTALLYCLGKYPQLLSSISCLDPRSRVERLLAMFRLCKFSMEQFGFLLDLEVLFDLLESTEQAVSFLAHRLYARLCQDCGHAIKGPAKFKDSLPILANVLEGLYTMQFLDLHEYSRLQLTALVLKTTTDEKTYTLREPLPECMVRIGESYLLSFVNKHPSNQSSLVETAHTKLSSKLIVRAMLDSRFHLIIGPESSGKTCAVEDIVHILGRSHEIVRLSLGPLTDAQSLLGNYVFDTNLTSAEWKAGTLTKAVRNGSILILDGIARASSEVFAILITLLKQRALNIPGRHDSIQAHPNLYVFAFVDGMADASTVMGLPGAYLWKLTYIQHRPLSELMVILETDFPSLGRWLEPIQATLEMLTIITAKNSKDFARPELAVVLKWCRRLDSTFQRSSTSEAITTDLLLEVFAHTLDVFIGLSSSKEATFEAASALARIWQLPQESIESYLGAHRPALVYAKDHVVLGRARLIVQRQSRINKLSLVMTRHAVCLLERLALSAQFREPVLLIGETGTGKTSIIQALADVSCKKLHVINLSQQTDISDLLGGFKPMHLVHSALELLNKFEALFSSAFGSNRNSKFLVEVRKAFSKRRWPRMLSLLIEAAKAAMKKSHAAPETELDPSRKKRQRRTHVDGTSEAWQLMLAELDAFSKILHSQHLLQITFVEGLLVRALKAGDWVLLDEINLAEPDVLDSILSLLKSNTVTLAERGDTAPITTHADFRLFACMNPATDVGKHDLERRIKTRFTQYFVGSPGEEMPDLILLIQSSLGSSAIGYEALVHQLAMFYHECMQMVQDRRLVDSSGERPCFSMRTLVRALAYTKTGAERYGVKLALHEALCMCFKTALSYDSCVHFERLLALFNLNAGAEPHVRKALKFVPDDTFVLVDHYLLSRGSEPIYHHPGYIITGSVRHNLSALSRAVSARKYPILLQGPTSSGKTSLISYLAQLTGHKFVRINNHEHTELEEYLGSYVADETGALRFQEGLLVSAIRHGHWLVLDELNLAPTDVLEALNRLLDDNRELLINETQEIVKPHGEFQLFATQNPAGLYGGRKHLSRAFRNRFLELHFTDLPISELEQILCERSEIPQSYAKKIVDVYKELSMQRQSTRIFELKDSYLTLRDLFRWSQREASSVLDLALNGYHLIGERTRSAHDRVVVQHTIERVMRVRLDAFLTYESLPIVLPDKLHIASNHEISWTKSMRRLFYLVLQAFRNHEPVILVGETGCGKTTVCSLIAAYLKSELHTLNAHENTEAADFIGSLRPNRISADMTDQLSSLLGERYNNSKSSDPNTLQKLCQQFMRETDPTADDHVVTLRSLCEQYLKLFQWVNGPLVEAMLHGHVFLLDEISLAEDAVLERLNSVLETDRTITLTEKGGDATSVRAADTFQFCATMNPGGDYGKRELSPALRNRFTEIWVPNVIDDPDIDVLLSAALPADRKFLSGLVLTCARILTSFRFQRDVASSQETPMLRDILAWLSFCAVKEISIEEAFVHGAAVVYLDRIALQGSNNLNAALTSLSQVTTFDCVKVYSHRHQVSETGNDILAGPFQLSAVSMPSSNHEFDFSAGTTSTNLFRIIRAMQLNRPILLEGDPGVGKSSLITALARKTAHKLVRINLSEQTDLEDLFGHDTPNEESTEVTFTWRDAPFLQAMNNGSWVLLDEMNLAPQTVLEGLNACLDHRAEVFIPELNRFFKCHSEFRVFAAQNPASRGNGRKNLPKSLTNRFITVHCGSLNTTDYISICQSLMPKLDQAVNLSAIELVEDFRQACGSGSLKIHDFTGEFNLRDILRLLSLQDASAASFHRLRFADRVLAQRFRTVSGHDDAVALCRAAGSSDSSHQFCLKESSLCIGEVYCRRLVHSDSFMQSDAPLMLPDLSLAQTCLIAISQAIPCIISGHSGSGKRTTILTLAQLLGHRVETLTLNRETDASDLLGNYEMYEVSERLRAPCTELLIALIAEFQSFLRPVKQCVLDVIGELRTRRMSPKLLSAMSELQSAGPFPGRIDMLIQVILVGATGKPSKRFEWVAGPLTKAVRNGTWLILENASLCSSAVLDRLNCLLEPRGQLLIDDHVDSNGAPIQITPHPNFRLFMTMNPEAGELSSAMRNRALECSLVRKQPLHITSLNSEQEHYGIIIQSGCLNSTEDPQLLAANLVEYLGDQSDISAIQQLPMIHAAQQFLISLLADPLLNTSLASNAMSLIRGTIYLSDMAPISPETELASCFLDSVILAIVVVQTIEDYVTKLDQVEFPEDLNAIRRSILRCSAMMQDIRNALMMDRSSLFPLEAIQSILELLEFLSYSLSNQSWSAGKISRQLVQLITYEKASEVCHFIALPSFLNAPNYDTTALNSWLNQVAFRLWHRIGVHVSNSIYQADSAILDVSQLLELKDASSQLTQSNARTQIQLLTRLDIAPVLSSKNEATSSYRVLADTGLRAVPQTRSLIHHQTLRFSDAIPVFISMWLVQTQLSKTVENSDNWPPASFRLDPEMTCFRIYSSTRSSPIEIVPVVSEETAASSMMMTYLLTVQAYQRISTSFLWKYRSQDAEAPGSQFGSEQILQDWMSVLHHKSRVTVSELPSILEFSQLATRTMTTNLAIFQLVPSELLVQNLRLQLRWLLSLVDDKTEGDSQMTSDDPDSIFSATTIPEPFKARLIYVSRTLCNTSPIEVDKEKLANLTIFMSQLILGMVMPEELVDPAQKAKILAQYTLAVNSRRNDRMTIQRRLHTLAGQGHKSLRMKQLSQLPGIKVADLAETIPIPDRVESDMSAIRDEYRNLRKIVSFSGLLSQILDTSRTDCAEFHASVLNLMEMLEASESRLTSTHQYRDIHFGVQIGLTQLKYGLSLLLQNTRQHRADSPFEILENLMNDVSLSLLSPHRIFVGIVDHPRDLRALLLNLQGLKCLRSLGYEKDCIARSLDPMLERLRIANSVIRLRLENEQGGSIESSLEDFFTTGHDVSSQNQHEASERPPSANNKRLLATILKTLYDILVSQSSTDSQLAEFKCTALAFLTEQQHEKGDQSRIGKAEMTPTAAFNCLESAQKNEANLGHCTLSQIDSALNFYHGSNLSRVTQVAAFLSLAKSELCKAINDNLEDSQLTDIIAALQHLQAMPSETAVVHIVISLEQVLTQMSAWNDRTDIKRSGVNMQHLIDELQHLCASLRQLELNSWPSLLRYEHDVLIEHDVDTWFDLYAMLTEAIYYKPQSQPAKVEEVIEVILSMLLSTSIGLFEARLRYLHIMRNWLQLREKTPLAGHVLVSLSNILLYFSKHLKHVQKQIQSETYILTEQIQDICRLIKVKMNNIHAFRENMGRSHRALQKVVHAFRKMLRQPFVIPDASLSYDFASDIGGHTILSNTVDQASPQSVQDLPLLLHRYLRASPSRYVDSKQTQMRMLNMLPQTGRVSHSLYDLMLTTTDHIVVLRNETPTMATAQNLVHLKHLKTRKRKLFSDTLKILKSMSFRSRVSQDDVLKQANLRNMLGYTKLSPDGNSKLLDGFVVLLDTLPCLRACEVTLHDDLAKDEWKRATGYWDSILLCLRQELAAYTCFVELKRLYNSGVQTISKLMEDCSEVHSQSKQILKSMNRAPSHQMLRVYELLSSTLKETHDTFAKLRETDDKTDELDDELPWLESILLRTMVDRDRLRAMCNRPACLESMGLDLRQFHTDLQGIWSHLITRRANSVLHTLYAPLRQVLDIIKPSQKEDWAQPGLDVICDESECALILQKLESELDRLLIISQLTRSIDAYDDLGNPNFMAEHKYLLATINRIQSSKVDEITKNFTEVACTLMNSSLPAKDSHGLLQHYGSILTGFGDLLGRFELRVANFIELTMITATNFAKIMISLAREGFCSPVLQDHAENDTVTVTGATGLGSADTTEAKIAADPTLDEEELKEDQMDVQTSNAISETPSAPHAEEDKDSQTFDNEVEQDFEAELESVTNHSEVSDISSTGSDISDELNTEALDQEHVEESWDDPRSAEESKEQRRSNEQIDNADPDQHDASLDGEDPGDPPEEQLKNATQDSTRSDSTQGQEQEHYEPLRGSDPPADSSAVKQDTDPDSISSVGSNPSASDASEGEVEMSNIDEVEVSDLQSQASMDLSESGSVHSAESDGQCSVDGEDLDQTLSPEPLGDHLSELSDAVDDEQFGTVDTGTERGQMTNKNSTTDGGEPLTKAEKSTAEQNQSASAPALMGVVAGDNQITDDKPQDSTHAHPEEVSQDYRQVHHINSASSTRPQEHVEEAAAFEHLQDHSSTHDTIVMAPDNGSETLTSRPQGDVQSSAHLQKPQKDTDEISEMTAELGVALGRSGDRNAETTPDSQNSSLRPQETPFKSEVVACTHEARTRSLAMILCEKLRLTLVPNLRSKLRGDFKSGRRLNMRRIIPYIASDYQKDKIWLRRTKPSKRQYQIMLAVDDSKSMAESGSVSMALDSIALVTVALNQLESGELSVVKFGEAPMVLRDLSAQSAISVSDMLEQFTFQSETTDLVQLLQHTIATFKLSRSRLRVTDTDLWQMQVIISDGICGAHESLRLLLREALQHQIMVVFVVLDVLHTDKSHSILDMKEAQYVEEPLTGTKTLQVRSYMEDFPFDYRIILQDIEELPSRLASCLQQFFEATADL